MSSNPSFDGNSSILYFKMINAPSATTWCALNESIMANCWPTIVAAPYNLFSLMEKWNSIKHLHSWMSSLISCTSIFFVTLWSKSWTQAINSFNHPWIGSLLIFLTSRLSCFLKLWRWSIQESTNSNLYYWLKTVNNFIP